MSLTSLIADKSSSFSVFLREEFPSLKSAQSRYLNGAPGLKFPPSSANPGTVGTAYDWRVRLLVDAHPDMTLPLAGAMRIRRKELSAALLTLLAESGIPATTGPITIHPMPDLESFVAKQDEEWICRFSWVLALYTELFRSGAVFPGSPLSLLGSTPSPDDLMALAPDDACRDIATLANATRDTLLPILKEREPVHLGPTFAGSRAVGGADADMCASGLLIEVKSSAGDKRSDGTRRCSLDKSLIYQLLGYVLLDWDDALCMDSIALYAVRFDYLVVWPIEELFVDLRINRPRASLAELRSDFQRAISSSGDTH